MTDLTIENINKALEEINKYCGKPNFMPLRCPSCNVMYSYFYEGVNPNIKTEDHKKDCSFNEVFK